MVEVETSEELEFKWGKKKGKGGRNKDVQFYESFTYDGVEYGLYDCVYLYKESEAEPEIGKLIKIWETGEKAKKVKVLWFFRPCEILNFLGAEEILENELFLASGEGVGLANLNPLDRRTWFKGFPWEDRMQTAHEQGTLVLLQNLDPAYTSAEVEDIVWHGFKESCTAKMIQRISNSSPHSGQALVIFKTREAAQMVVRKLEEGCLLLSNGRPLVGSIGTRSAEKKPIFFGHLVIDKLRQQMMREREMKEAVSTSHCSQPNTTEYDMAMEWCLLQERSDLVWGNLYKQQGKELRKLKAELKAK